jgi:TRAP-type C4-dicarboxylate transport system permease small subunit
MAEPQEQGERMLVRSRGLPGLLEAAAFAVGGIGVMAMMLLTFADVIGRYAFSRPIPGAFEITEVLLAGLVFLGLPLVTARGEHVSVHLLDDRLPTGIRRFVGLGADLLVVLCLIVLGWQLATKSVELARYGDQTVFLHIPLAPLAGLMSALSFVSALIVVALARRRRR